MSRFQATPGGPLRCASFSYFFCGAHPPVQDQLPDGIEGIVNVFLGLLIWLDQGQVTRRLQMYPIVLRAAWLTALVRNGSGNGGGAIMAFMPEVRERSTPHLEFYHSLRVQLDDPRDTSDCPEPLRAEFARARAALYQAALGVMLCRIRQISWKGIVWRCCDEIIRRCFIDIIIASLDGKEASAFCGVRSARANYPSAQCLVHRGDLRLLNNPCKLRTNVAMEAVYELAQEQRTKTAKEEILRKYGLLDTKVRSYSAAGSYLLNTFVSLFYGNIASRTRT
jgi:hypothetical protein